MNQQDRVHLYRTGDFQKMFNEFDDDKNGYLSKGEMAQFIKEVF